MILNNKKLWAQVAIFLLLVFSIGYAQLGICGVLIDKSEKYPNTYKIELDFGDNLNEKDIAELIEAAAINANKLTEIIIDGVVNTDRGLEKILNHFAASTKLRSLIINVTGYRITKASAKNISKGIRNNTDLQELSFLGVEFDDEGIEEVLRAMVDSGFELTRCMFSLGETSQELRIKNLIKTIIQRNKMISELIMAMSRQGVYLNAEIILKGDNKKLSRYSDDVQQNIVDIRGLQRSLVASLEVINDPEAIESVLVGATLGDRVRRSFSNLMELFAGESDDDSDNEKKNPDEEMSDIIIISGSASTQRETEPASEDRDDGDSFLAGAYNGFIRLFVSPVAERPVNSIQGAVSGSFDSGVPF